jgi:SpoVK/Ycf46/Vps4 family AAA+-type ATPase
MEVLQRISPKTVSEFIGNKLQIKKINEYISTPSYGTILFITGPDGCGKTTLCNLLFSNVKYNILNVLNKSVSVKDISYSIQNFIQNKSIDAYFNKKPKIIYIDDIDILINTDKGILSTLVGFQEEFTKYQILCIGCCNQKDEKKLLELKKIELIRLSYPQVRDVYPYLMECDLGIDDDVLLKIINKYRGCIRDIIMNLNDLEIHSKIDSKIDSKKCFKDMNNFEVINYIFKNGLEITNINNIYKDNAGIIGFIMYENFCDELYNKKNIGRKSLIDTYLKGNMYFVNSSIFDNDDIVNILRINSISNIILDRKDKKIQKDYKYTFPQTLSKISQKNVMNRKLNKLQQSLNNLNYENILMISDIVLQKNLTLTQRSEEKYFINTYEKYFVS